MKKVHTSTKKKPSKKPRPIDLNDSNDLDRVLEMYPKLMQKFGAKNVKFFYEHNVAVATYYDRDTGTYFAGFSFCKDGDQFSKQLGRAISLYRIFINDPKFSSSAPYCGNGFATMHYCWWLCNNNFPEDWKGMDFPRHYLF